MWLEVNVLYQQNPVERNYLNQISNHSTVVHKDFSIGQVLDGMTDQLQFRNLAV